MTDPLGTFVPTPTAPATGGFNVTPHDSNELAIWTRQIRANTAGVITYVGADGVVHAANFLAGESRSIRAKIIKATGTTCTGIEGLY